MSWNYRIIRYEDGSCGLHEVFYDQDGAIKAVSENPCGFVGDDLSDLLQGLERALNDAQSLSLLYVEDLPHAKIYT